MTAARVRYQRPKAYVAADTLAHAETGIQVDVYTDEEFAVRAAAPVLFVGGNALTESERVGPNHYRFHGLSPEAKQMTKGDVLRFGWSSYPQDNATLPDKGTAPLRTRRVRLPAIEDE